MSILPKKYKMHYEVLTMGKIFSYPMTIKEVNLDLFGHVNNAEYLVLFEEARWDLIHKNGYGLKKIWETNLGPTILEIKMRFLKELKARDEIVIESELLSYEKKVGKLRQDMKRGGEVCCSLELTIALFDMKERKLALPTPDWLKAVGGESV